MLVFENVRKSYGTALVLDRISLTLKAGEIFGLLGPNGAGKSTLISLASGIASADEGTICVADLGSPRCPSVRHAIGLAPQKLALYEELTVLENLQFFASMFGLDKRIAEDRIAWALDFVGLYPNQNQFVRTFSTGMARRLNLAAALLHRPKLLLLDEATAGVDPQSRHRLIENLQSLKNEGCCILYTTHLIDEIEKICSRVGILDHGRLLAIDQVDKLIKKFGGPSLIRFVHEQQPMEIQSLNPRQDLHSLSQRFTLDQLSVRPANLERVFLELTGRELRDQ